MFKYIIFQWKIHYSVLSQVEFYLKFHYFIQYIFMLKNKIYNYITLELLKTFILILFSLSLIAWTVRAVNFLDLIVQNGYSISNYFQYSFLNLFGILTKFIPLAFLLSLIIFIVKQIQEKEFIILWTSGVKKIKNYVSRNKLFK